MKFGETMPLVLFILLTCFSFASELDQNLDEYISRFRYQAVEPLKNDNKVKYRLGKKLFFDKRLSLKDSISCSTCHDPEFNSTDALPFSIGLGGHGIGTNRVQNLARITKRTSPSLYNKGHDDFDKMFWDGRVFYNSSNNRYYTPEEGLNGPNPKYAHITKELKSAMAAQALFPMLSDIEMKGESNLSNIEVWETITNKILKVKEYKEMILSIFKVSEREINIGHLANALAYFQSRFFQATNTNWDKYLRGDKNAMSDQEKRGAIVFSSTGRCSICHHGKHLTNFAFQNVGVPKIESTDHKGFDIGRFKVTNQNFHKFSFATQPLRNVAKTAPYFHNGSFRTLEDVVEHYLNARNSLYTYSLKSLEDFFLKNFNTRFSLINDSATLRYATENLHPLLRYKFSLSKREKKDLIHFLKESLTER